MHVIKATIFSAALLLLPSVCCAEDADPTFNGLAKVVHCNLSEAFFCDGDYCSSVPANGGNFWISLSTRQVSDSFPMGYSVTKPIEIRGVSPAAMNTPLVVKFAYVGTDNSSRNGSLIFLPRQGQTGGYDLRFGQTILGTGKSEGQRKLLGGQCEIHND